MHHHKIGKDDILEKYGIYFEQFKNKNLDNCPTPGRLLRYLNEELSEPDKKDIEDHIDFCPLCLSAFERFYQAAKMDQTEIMVPENCKELEKTISEDFYAYIESVSVPKEKREIAAKPNWIENLKLKWKSLWNSLFAPYHFAYAGAVVAILIISIYTFAYFARPGYFKLAQLEPFREHVYRSTETPQNEFTAGLKWFDQKKYGKAMIAFESYLTQNPHHYEANYYLGLSHLFQAEKKLPGLPYNFDKTDVNNGIKFLEKALQLTRENQFYQEDCYWYLGKAYLMKGELDKAKEQFEKIIGLSQPNLMRGEQAKEIIIQIKQLKRTNTSRY